MRKAIWTQAFPGQIKPRGIKREPRPRPPTRFRRIKPMSASRRRREAAYEKAKRKWWSTVQHLCCPVMLAIFGQRIPVAKQPHHIRGRTRKLLCCIKWWLAVSLEGHIWIENNKDQARARGWLAPKGEWKKDDDLD
jgi:hypothetical protein